MNMLYADGCRVFFPEFSALICLSSVVIVLFCVVFDSIGAQLDRAEALEVVETVPDIVFTEPPSLEGEKTIVALHSCFCIPEPYANRGSTLSINEGYSGTDCIFTESRAVHCPHRTVTDDNAIKELGTCTASMTLQKPQCTRQMDAGTWSAASSCVSRGPDISESHRRSPKRVQEVTTKRTLVSCSLLS